jgi:hypothetical protein
VDGVGDRFGDVFLGRLLLEEVRDVVAVALFGRRPARRGVRLEQVAHLFERRKLVPDGGGGDVETGLLGQPRRTHRLGGFHVPPDGQLQKRLLAGVEGFHS